MIWQGEAKEPDGSPCLDMQDKEGNPDDSFIRSEAQSSPNRTEVEVSLTDEGEARVFKPQQNVCESFGVRNFKNLRNLNEFAS